MKIKQTIVLILFLALIVAAGVITYYYRSSVLTKDFSTFSNQIPKESFAITDKKITDNTKPFKIDIVYPQVEGLDFFNKTVFDSVNKEIADFKNNSLQNDAAVKKVDPVDYAKFSREYDLSISYTKGEIDENVASVILNEYSFEGGAHGATNFLPLNYNPKTKTEIQLADLFVGQTDYLQKISDYCIKDLTKQIIKNAGSTDGTWIQDGAGPKPENYSIFLINKDNIVFYFPQYQVAPGTYGDFEVTMPK